MGFYIRDSLRVGPFRFNLSKSGIGLSIGVTGLRVGIGPGGLYLHAGRGGLYYRTSLRRLPLPALKAGAAASAMLPPGQSTGGRSEPPLVLALNTARQRAGVRGWLTILALLLVYSFYTAEGSIRWLEALLIAIVWFGGGRLDRWRRQIAYEFGNEAICEVRYKGLVATFDDLATSIGKWQVISERILDGTTERKRHADASRLVVRKPVKMERELPKTLRSNINPPALQLRSCCLYLLPEALLMEGARGFTLLPYGELGSTYGTMPFMEDGNLPPDAEVISYGWEHPNQNGGSDRRFSNNRKLPYCRYETVEILHSAGLNILLQFSRPGAALPFVDALNKFYKTTAVTNGEEVRSGSLDSGSSRETTDSTSMLDKMICAAAARMRTDHSSPMS